MDHKAWVGYIYDPPILFPILICRRFSVTLASLHTMLDDLLKQKVELENHLQRTFCQFNERLLSIPYLSLS